MKKIINFFNSVRLSLFLISLLIVLSALGSFYSKTDPYSGLSGWIIKLSGMSHDKVVDLLSLLGLANIYYSKLFIALLILLSMNLLVCTFKRTLNAKIYSKEKLYKSYFLTDSKSLIKIETADSIEEILKKLSLSFNKYSNYISCDNESKEYCFFASKGSLSKYAVYIVHLGVFVIILFGMLNGLFGYTGNIAILEGDMDNEVVLDSENSKVLPFHIRLDNFEVMFYENSTTPSNFYSKITILDNKNEVLGGDIQVNKPFKYKKIKIFQASYGFFPNKNVDFIFEYQGNVDKKTISTKMDEIHQIDNSLSFAVRDFIPSVAGDNEGKLINLNNMMINPAVLVEFFKDNKSMGQVPILARFSETGNFGDFILAFKKAYGIQYSVFSVNYNPFIQAIFIGFIILAIGVILAATIEHKVVMVTITDFGEKRVMKTFCYRNRLRSYSQELIDGFLKKIEANSEIEGGRKNV